MIIRYSDEILRRFNNPKNSGEIKNADGIGIVGSRVCGDVMHLFVKIENNTISDIKFKTLGCAAAISFSDALCDLAKNKSIEQALEIKKNDLIKELGGVPNIKLHCSLLAIEALHKAVEDFKGKK
ncbi:iron-sulfur cluster assembly scaffold protein [Candidatus Woesearchaeota archaeon]|nr:iron-sulfur cluster assembly scaffold protein [Candidatus Woesearchaeota archaeon]